MTDIASVIPRDFAAAIEHNGPILVEALASARTHAHDLYLGFTRAPGEPDLTNVGYLAFKLQANLERALELTCAIGLASVRIQSNDFSLEYELDRSRSLMRDLSLLCERAHDLGVGLDRAPELALLLSDSLGSSLDNTRALIWLVEHPDIGVKWTFRGQRRVPTRMAVRLAAIAAWLLPGAERARYREEFGSELADIALAEGGRRMQLAHASRTLRRAWLLRVALRAPRRRGAFQ